jgi:hypothetical protein
MRRASRAAAARGAGAGLEDGSEQVQHHAGLAGVDAAGEPVTSYIAYRKM